VRRVRWLRLLFKRLLLSVIVGGLAYWMKLSPVRAVAHRVEQGSVVAEVMGMGGIYRGLIEDATLLVDRIGADLCHS
jgi:hypothetical protein